MLVKSLFIGLLAPGAAAKVWLGAPHYISILLHEPHLISSAFSGCEHWYSFSNPLSYGTL